MNNLKNCPYCCKNLNYDKKIYTKFQQPEKLDCFGHIFKRLANTSEGRDSQFSRTTTGKLPGN